ncbi:MAG: hypothetical protein AB7U49_13070, partial [Hyphomicrobiaceae bacterium]
NPPNCYCPQGTVRKGDYCEKAQTCGPGTTPQYVRGRLICAPDRKCPGNLQGNPPNCYCPQGTVRKGDYCDKVTQGPPDCGPGKKSVRLRRGWVCVPDQVGKCPGNLQGNPPNCYCPQGMTRKGDYCAKAEQGPPDCGPGKKPLRVGNRWTCIPTGAGKCPGNLQGNPPNCYCPQGMTRKGDYCAKAEQGPPDCGPGKKPLRVGNRWTCIPTGAGKCPGNLQGNPPNCYCPPNTIRTGNFCQPKVVDTGPQKCGPGQRPARVAGRWICVGAIKPTPTPQPQPGPVIKKQGGNKTLDYIRQRRLEQLKKQQQPQPTAKPQQGGNKTLEYIRQRRLEQLKKKQQQGPVVR